MILKYLKTRIKYTENYRAFSKLKNMFKTVFKYLINRNKNRIKTVLERYFNVQYYLNLILK